MAQDSYIIPDSDGATFLANINDTLAAVSSTNKGPTRPGTVYPGQLWLDDNSPSASVWTLNLFDGSDDIPLGLFDTGSNTFYLKAGGGGEIGGNLFLHQTNTTQPGAGNTEVGGAFLKDGASGTILYLSHASANALVANRNSDGVIASFVRQGSAVGSVSVTAAGTAFNTSSDRRRKTRIKPFAGAGAILDALTIVEHGWRGHPKLPRSIGVIAQEAEAVFPAAVTPGDGDDGKKPGDEGFVGAQVDYSKFVPLLLAEVKALRVRVSSLEAASPVAP